MDSCGINPGNKHVMKASTGYDSIKSHVVETHDRVMDDINKVKNTLGQKNVKFDFA